MHNSVVVSRGPDELESIRSWDVDIELKFDWEHTALLRGDRDLECHLSAADIDPERIWSVHLPPGIGRCRNDVEMALTRRNRGTITSFVHDQLDIVPGCNLSAQISVLEFPSAQTARSVVLKRNVLTEI